MKTIALWLEFRFNLFLVPYEDFGNTKLSLCHLRTSFNEITPPPPPPQQKYGTYCHVRCITYTVLDGLFPYLAQMITSMRGCVARNDLWTWPISSKSFSCDVAYFMDCIHLWHKYNPWGTTISRSIDQRTMSRAIRIFVVGARGILTLVDEDLKFVVMMTSSNGNIFRVTDPFVRGIHRLPVNPPHKGQWRGDLMFSLICAWTNGWVNNRGAGDLRHHCAHYDVIVMSTQRLAHRHLP